LDIARAVITTAIHLFSGPLAQHLHLRSANDAVFHAE
jgi:hypothetical protein